MTNNYKFVLRKKNSSIVCVMMTSSLPDILSKDIQLYCPRLRAYHCGIWYFVTSFVDDCHIASKINKETSYRLIDDDVVNMQTVLKIHIQLYFTSAMACHSKTLVLWALSY